MSDGRLPTALWVDAVLKPLNDRGIYYYITQKGNHDSGMILLKLNGLGQGVKLLTQERDFFEDKLTWVNAIAQQDNLEESDVDAYIQKALQRDPDLWVIEIEDPGLNNPFDV